MTSNQPEQPVHSDARRMNIIKLALGCTGVGMVLCTGIIMLVLIVAPIVFRSLEPYQWYEIEKHAPFMSAFKPTDPVVVLPTSVGANGNAMALLASPIAGGPTLMPAKNSGGLSSGEGSDSGPKNQVVPTSTPLPPSKTPTLTPTSSAPVSPSPVVAFAEPSPVVPAFTATPIPSPTPVALPASFHSNGFKWVAQGWNDCGPANLTQALNYYGWQGTQTDAANWLKPNREDKNVSPWQMVEFVRSQTGVKAIQRVGGDLTLIKRLVVAKFAVIMETGYDVAGEGWMGHYLTVVGYDDNLSTLYGLDTWLGTGPDHLGFHEDYQDIDHRWTAFNRLFIVVYPPDREDELSQILGPDADLNYNAYHALSVARTEASSHPDDPFTWFDMGSSYVLLKKYQEAATAFDHAFSVGGLPPRMLWYQFTPYEAYYNIGNYTNVLALVQTMLTSTPYVEETFYWRGMAEAAQGKDSQAVEDFKRVLSFNSNYSPAQDRINEIQAGKFSVPAVAQATQ